MIVTGSAHEEAVKAQLPKLSNANLVIDIDTLLWAYDMEFFTWRYAAKQMRIRENNFYNRCIVQLQQKELLFHYFDRYRAHKTFEDAMFREDGWNSYKVRFTLTQKARNIVDKLYKELQNVE
jgi:hypothetical protein